MIPTDYEASVIHFIDFNKVLKQDFKHFPLPSKTNLEFLKEDFEIARISCRLIRILQILGMVPISIHKQGDEIHYRYKRTSFIWLYCWISAYAAVILVFVYLLNRELDIDWPLRIFKAINDNALTGSDAMDNIFKLVIPTAAMLITFTARFNFHELARFLNNWTMYLREFRLNFSTFYTVDFHRLDAITKRMFKICTFIVCSGIIASTRSSFPRLLVDNYRQFNVALLLCSWIYFGFGWFLNAAVSVLSLNSVKSSIRELGYAIKAQHKVLHQGIAYEDVKMWIRFLSLLRDQVRLLQIFTSLPELSDLLSTFLMLLSLLLVVFTRVLHGLSPSETIPIAVVSVLFGFIRLFGKAYVAELVAEEEEKIAIMVIGMKSDDCKTRLEMKILIDLIMTNPIKIIYAKWLVLNRRLLLSLVSQLAAYLVVLIQFQASSVET